MTMPTLSREEMLADWHRLLHDHDGWKNQSCRYSSLMSSADYMLRTGTIDPFERFELVELLVGAYCHFTEEYPPEWMHPASDYSVYNQAGELVGFTRGNRYFLGRPDKKRDPMSFFAQFEPEGSEKRIRTTTYQHYGVIRDRFIYTETGQKLALVETGRQIQGKEHTRLDDPDVYRSLLDASVIALEAGDMPTFVALREKELFSIFTVCPACCDRFDLREDCVTCDGRGFIEDPNCPSRLPPDFVQSMGHP
ncbi:hypothetical protein ACIPL1_30475 [Pseudomonas sp. NPDC090202]|uniref:hypothetical protein n=1 Tax=Pseudomonas sp. NPDC090202 TaxID=3364476 RepID=UPI00382D6FFC